MKKTYSKSWVGSKKPSKQRKYRKNAPLHIKQRFASVHLSKELKAKYKIRSVQLKKGDKVKVVRGQFKGKTGKVERIDVTKQRVFITGIETTKKDGGKVFYPLHPSNLLITELVLEDKRRTKSLERK